MCIVRCHHLKKSFSYSITQKVIRREQAMKDGVFRKLFRNIDGQQKSVGEKKKTHHTNVYVPLSIPEKNMIYYHPCYHPRT